MKIYKHTGDWHYIGCKIIIIETDLLSAQRNIRSILDNTWLKNEELNIEEIEMNEPKEILIDNWDY
jgi:hypothetical protein